MTPGGEPFGDTLVLYSSLSCTLQPGESSSQQNRMDAWKSARLDLKSKVEKSAKVAKTSFLKKNVSKICFPNGLDSWAQANVGTL